MLVILISALIAFICLLFFLVLDGQRQLKRLLDSDYRERMSSQYRWHSLATEQRQEIVSLTETLARGTSNSYTRPGESDPLAKDKLPASPSAFRMKPNPPVGVTVTTKGTD